MRFALAALLATPLSLAAQPLTLQSSEASITWNLSGGGLVDFQTKAHRINPFTWEERSATEARLRGHFLCMDRWGAPSKAEIAAGVPFHGEASRVVWRAVSTTPQTAVMAADLPLARLHIQRTAKLDGASVLVTEAVTNTAPMSRVYNMVQHPTIGPPFLDESTVVDSNARRGFMQSSPMPNPEHPEVVWPQALKDGQPVNLRHLTTDPLPNVVSFVIDEPLGWVTAIHPGRRLMLAYVWRTSDYPWLNIWRHVEAGKPFARGLEFGTTGLHQPYPILMEKGRIFGRLLFAYIDASETQSRTYQLLQAEVPAGTSGITRLETEGTNLVFVTREGARVSARNLLAVP